MKVLVLGGTAWLGHEIAAALVARGHVVTCAARGSAVPAGVDLVHVDRDDDGLSVFTRDRWDAVVDVARQPGHVRRAARDLEPVAQLYVFVSTGNVYSSQAEVGADEDAELLAPLTRDAFTDTEEYGPAKVACETALGAAFGDDRLLIARAGLIGGPGDHTQRTTYWPWRFAHPAVPGEVLVPDAPELPVSVIDVRDLADWLVRCIERRTTGTFNAMGTPVALPEHLTAARRAARRAVQQPVPVPAPEPWLQESEVAEWSGPRSLPLWLIDRSWYGFNARSNARALAAGLELRPLEETLRDGLAWREAHPDQPVTAGLTDADEAALLRSLSTR